MKFTINQIIAICSIILILMACGKSQDHSHDDDHTHEEAGHHDEESEKVHLSAAQFEALDMKVGELPRKNLSSIVQANGELEVPPQNEANVTAILGANVVSIKVIEGDDIKKGQALAYLSHPNLTRLQSEYLEAHNQLLFLEQEFQRQKRLYEAEVGSGKTYQQTQAEYNASQAIVKSLGSQLRQLGMSPQRIEQGEFYDQVPVVSPIEGTIVKVNIKTGQYVQPEKELFEIVNTHHIHADLMVFEKDVFKVHVGQRVRFTVETLPGEELYAEIYSVGKKFEQDPKAIHIHAEIENKEGHLIPGMYIKGQILTDSVETFALPESAITREGNEYLTFIAEKEQEGSEVMWMFTPTQILTGTSNNGWVEVKLLQEFPGGTQFVLNNAYYLLAEMKKEEAGHSH